MTMYNVHIAKLSANKTEILKLKVSKDKFSPYLHIPQDSQDQAGSCVDFENQRAALEATPPQ